MKAITINAAKHLGVDERVGSLEPGKDADVVVWSGDPFDARSTVEKTLINGETIYDSGISQTNKKRQLSISCLSLSSFLQ
ncbi:amidohydrolase family protein [Fictibacillus sp. KU28468]|uniref:amidohydrolase family protein n=1 Tax=Fictibacillus sp. KU28468 TaxID=2991053 RepID=UPI00223DAC80|nr:amidohydrolase family protein [Fictibacillus sp. KU28468]UZJ77992.1 amidohydrolase family protein [Fictibacillus sp. KU28468]